MTDTDVSFCLPVYNVKPYLEKCIASICDQGLERFEILCVDDCSTDGSLDELNRLAGLHPEVRVIRNEENRGVSAARNRGLDEARGRYVWFVDPDDLLVSGSGALYLKIADEHRAEAVLGRNFSFRDGSELQVPQTGDSISTADFRDPRRYYQFDNCGVRSHGVWLGIFSKAYLKEHGIRYREDLRFYEDLTYHIEVGFHSTNFISVDHFGYLYRIRGSSASRNKDGEHFKHCYESARRSLEIACEYRRKCEKPLEEALDAHVQFCKDAVCMHLVRVPDRGYVKRELRMLKKQGLYPYRTDWKLVFYEQPSRKTFIIHRLLPHRLGFYLIHAGFRWKARKQHGQEKC